MYKAPSLEKMPLFFGTVCSLRLLVDLRVHPNIPMVRSHDKVVLKMETGFTRIRKN